MREKNEINAWIHFFLDGITETAKNGVETFDRILQFQRTWESEIQSWSRQANSGFALFQYLFTHLCVDAQQVAKAAAVSQPTAYKLIKLFVTAGLLKE